MRHVKQLTKVSLPGLAQCPTPDQCLGELWLSGPQAYFSCKRTSKACSP